MDQYSSPKIWGPHFWFMIDVIAHNYPSNPTKQDGVHIKNILYELQYHLPCRKCKYTYTNHINKYPINNALESKEKLIEWVNFLKKMTNKVILDNRVRVIEPVYEQVDEKPMSTPIINRNNPSNINNNNTNSNNNNQGFNKINPFLEKKNKNSPKNSCDSKECTEKKQRIRKIVISKKDKVVENNPYPTNYDYYQNKNSFYEESEFLIPNKPRPYFVQENEIELNKSKKTKQLKVTFKCKKCE